MIATDLLVLSPHLDDAVLSVGGAIAMRAAARANVVVATLFTADEPQSPPSPVARDHYRAWGLDPPEPTDPPSLAPRPANGSIYATRRDEDLTAMGELGARALHLGLPDCLIRLDPVSRHALYADAPALVGPLHPSDEPFLRVLAQALAGLFATIQPVEVWVPLAVGRQVDHQLVRLAGEQLVVPSWSPPTGLTANTGTQPFGPPRLRFYEDYPYRRRFGAVWRATRPWGGWTKQVEPVSATALATKQRAAAAYVSQVGPLFGSREQLDRELTRDVAKRGGERLWSRRRHHTLGPLRAS